MSPLPCCLEVYRIINLTEIEHLLNTLPHNNYFNENCKLFYKIITLAEISHLLKICYYTAIQNPTLRGASVASISQVRTSAMVRY